MPQPTNEEKKQEWQENFRQQQQSGLSIKRWCFENQIATQSFYYWRTKLFPKPSVLNRSHFTELPDSREVGIAIECNGVRVHLNKYFDSPTLKRCLAVLKGLKC